MGLTARSADDPRFLPASAPDQTREHRIVTDTTSTIRIRRQGRERPRQLSVPDVGTVHERAVKLRGREVPYFSTLGLGHVPLEDLVVVKGGRALHLGTRPVADGSNARSCL